MDYEMKDIINVFQKYPHGIQTNNSKITVDQSEFTRKFNVFTNGILQDLDFTNCILIGGSLFSMLDNNVKLEELSSMNSDIDLFILKDEPASTFDKFHNVLQFFKNYAEKHNLCILFVSRGVLIEVLIENCRRIQIILSSYNTPAKCISSLGLIHLHMYYDGQLYASEQAIDNIKRRETLMCRAPMKDTKISTLISRGITPVGDIILTRMDSAFYISINDIDSLKEAMDNRNVSDQLEKLSNYLVTNDICEIYHHTCNLAKNKWNDSRSKILRQLKITVDIDMFDLSIRLPAPEVLCRCVFVRCEPCTASSSMRKRKILKIKSSFSLSPALFAERSLQLTSDFQIPKTELSEIRKQEQEIVELNVMKNDNLRYLERYFKREIVFRYVSNFTHILDKRGLLFETNIKNDIIPIGSNVNINFVIIIFDSLHSTMFCDIVEISLR